jgi:glucokinase
MAIVLPEHGAWRIVAGEGGHVAFAPADEQQLALWTFLHARHGRVTWERVVSGPGLTAINELVAGISLSPEQIADRALADPTGAERRSLDMFLAAYGAFAGDMALACLARGGVFLAGGIAAKLLPTCCGKADFWPPSRPRPNTPQSPRACRSTSPPIRCWACAARCGWHETTLDPCQHPVTQ